MVAYKWVIKLDDKYYSLMNFGINEWMPSLNLPPYELNHIYHSPKDYDLGIFKKIRRKSPHCFEKDGYHFWKYPMGKGEREFIIYNRFLKYKKKPRINAVLKCKVMKILKENEHRLIAEEFCPLEEINFKSSVLLTKVV